MKRQVMWSRLDAPGMEHLSVIERHDEQRYTCLEADAAGGRYRFEQVGSGFTAVLQVDADGLVDDYPGLFKRVWAG